METKNLQAELPLGSKPKRMEVDPAVIRRQASMLAAIKLCVQYGGFAYEKEVYQSLDIDAGNWSRMMNGSAAFPPDKLIPLMDLCGNEAPLQWIAFKRGYQLQPLQDEKDKLIAELRERLTKQEAVLEWMEGRVKP